MDSWLVTHVVVELTDDADHKDVLVPVHLIDKIGYPEKSVSVDMPAATSSAPRPTWTTARRASTASRSTTTTRSSTRPRRPQGGGSCNEAGTASVYLPEGTQSGKQ